jgi:uncharacterized protein YjbJ (UPF0337 family)
MHASQNRSPVLLHLLLAWAHPGGIRGVTSLGIPGTRFQSEEQTVGNKDRASNKLQDAKGKVKENVGSAVGNKDLENKGKTDQAKAGMKDAGEDVKDAVHKVKDAVTR